MSQVTISRTGDGLEEPATWPGRRLLDALRPFLPALEAQAEHNDREAAPAVALIENLREKGVLGATVPAALGGMGVECMYDVAVGLQAIAAADPGTALGLHMQFSRGLTLAYEWQHGTPSARTLAERLLREMGTGDAIVCGAVKDVRTTTALTPAGPGTWSLSGRKTMISMASLATHFVVSAQVHDGGEQIGTAAPVVARSMPGVTVEGDWDGLGMRSSDSQDITFDGCLVPASEILPRGPLGQRNDAALAGQTVSSITMMGIYVGICRAARRIAVDHVCRRGKASAAARTLVSEIDARIYALQLTVSAALRQADLLADDLDGDLDERGRAMMTPFQWAKLMLNRHAVGVVDDCMAIVGGAAYAGSHPLSKLYRDVRAGGFMQPFTYVDGVDYLSEQAFGF